VDIGTIFFNKKQEFSKIK